MVLGANGRVGLGTSVPQGNLHIFGQANEDVFNGIGTDLNTGPAFNFGYSGSSFGRGSGFFNVRPDASAVAPNPSLRFATANTQRMIITNMGRVGIGTLNPTQALDVTGNIRASGSFIANATQLNVPDYVFAPEYDLRPLPELARYVERERHLPGIPSAKEITQQGGMDLAEMQLQLLTKVEELTLYTIAQDRALTRHEQHAREQEAVISELRSAVATLMSRLAALEHGHGTRQATGR